MATFQTQKKPPLRGTAAKKRKLSLSPEKEPGAVAIKILDYADEVELLRQKSSNLNGTVSGSMKDAINNIKGNLYVLIGLKEKETDALLAKIAELSRENEDLKEKLKKNGDLTVNESGDRNLQNVWETPKSSRDPTSGKRGENSSQGFSQIMEVVELEEGQKRAEIPRKHTYAESLRVNLPPEKDTIRNGNGKILAGQTQQVRVVEEKKKPRLPPPTFIRVRGNGIAYGELATKVKTGVDPENFGIMVLSVRKLENEDLELRVRGGEEDIAKYKLAITECIGNVGTARKIVPMAFIHVSDLESETEESKIISDVAKICQIEPDEIMVTSLRPAFGGAQKATCKLPKSAAEKLAEIGRVKVGYVYCRVQIRAFAMRCFRCGENGHVAANCKGPDRSGLCFQCGSKEHKIQGCPEKRAKTNKVHAN